jgi:capsular exopolysaccharide synthesis family protein
MSKNLMTREHAELEPFSGPMLSGDFAGSDDDISIADLWSTIYKRKWIIASCLLVCVAAAAAYCIFRTPRYTASARVQLDDDNSNSLNLQDLGISMPGGADEQTKAETQVRILDSDTLALEVMKQLHLNEQPLFFKKTAAGDPKSLPPKTRDELLKAWHKSLTVKSIAKTELIDIEFRSKSPKLSADAINTLLNAYVERNFRVKYEASMQASDWLSKQIDDIKAGVQKSEEKLADFQKKSGILALSTDPKTGTVESTATARLEQIEKSLTEAQADRIVKEAKYRTALSADPEVILGIVPDPSLVMLRSQQTDLKNQYTEATTKYGAAFPRVRQLKAQLDSVNAAVAKQVGVITSSLKTESDAAIRAENMLVAAFDKEKGEAYKTNEGAMQMQIMMREAEGGRDLYQDLLKKLKEAGIVAGLKSTNLNVVDYAQIPSEPSDPNVPVTLAMGLGAGLLVGLVAAFIFENLDTTLTTVEEVEQFSGLPSLGTIPKLTLTSRKSKKKLPGAIAGDSIELIALRSPKSHAAEAYRALRSSILLSRSDEAPKVISVTSTFPAEGKSTTSINVATVLAQKGARVLLIDADMRRSSLHQKMKLRLQPGLSGVLTHLCSLDEAMVQVEDLPTLYLLPAGAVPPYPAELLGSSAMKELLEAARKQFDYVIVDTPPVLTVTDGIVVATETDVTLLVFRAGETSKHALRRSRDLLLRSRAKIAGVVLNAVDFGSPDHYYYYGSSKYYEYYEKPELTN